MAFYLLLVAVLSSCETQIKQERKRKYDVRLSNWIGSDWYKCDTVIWLNNQHLQLQNQEDNKPFMDIVISKEVVVRVSLNGN